MRYVLTLLLCLFGAPALACDPALYQGGQPPAVTADREVCTSHFAVGYLDSQHGPVWSAERLTPEDVTATKAISRHCRFRLDPTIPDDVSINASWYVRSGWDRGHLSPDGDQPTEQAQQESCDLANIAPQNPRLNRVTWRAVEAQVQRLVIDRDEPAYIVTGVIYAGDPKPAAGEPGIPVSFWKAVAIGGKGWAVVSANVEPKPGSCSYMPVTELERRLGAAVFPALSAEARSARPDVSAVAGCHGPIEQIGEAPAGR